MAFQRKLEELLKIKINVADANKIDLEQLYQDNLPPETKQLEEFVEREIINKESSKDLDIEKVKEKFDQKFKHIKEKLLPEEGRDQKKISKLRMEQFLQDEDKRNRLPTLD